MNHDIAQSEAVRLKRLFKDYRALREVTGGKEPELNYETLPVSAVGLALVINRELPKDLPVDEICAVVDGRGWERTKRLIANKGNDGLRLLYKNMGQDAMYNDAVVLVAMWRKWERSEAMLSPPVKPAQEVEHHDDEGLSGREQVLMAAISDTTTNRS